MKISFFQSLRFRTPFWVLLGVIPPILIAIGYGTFRVNQAIEANTKEKIASETHTLSENVSRWITMNVLAVQNLSRQPAMISLNAKQQKPILEEFVKTYSHLYLASVTGLNGFNIARSDNESLKEYSTREWFLGAKAGNEITWQALVGKTNNKPVACSSTPVRRLQEIIAVAHSCSTLDEITQQVGAIKIGKTGYAIVVDQKGQLLAHPNSSLVTGENLADYSNFPPIKSLLAGQEGHYAFTDEKGTEWISYSTLLTNGWGVAVVQETAEAFLQQKQLQLITWEIAIGLITLTGLAIFFIANRLVAPITLLTEISSAFASGKLDQRINLNRDDEIGILGDSFNKMAQELQQSIIKAQNQADEQRKQKEELEKSIYILIDEISDATEGDLTVRANLDSMELSTVADLFNAVIYNLQEIAIAAKQSSSQVSDSLRQNEKKIRFLAQQAVEETQETHNILLSVEQMSQSIKAVAQKANQAEQIADDSYNTVLNSSKNMDLTVNSILNLRNTVKETAKQIKSLGESSQQISQAVSLIEEIALKTNVLAINAGAEADRAGEYGRGFGVIAEQVGLLAEQCRAATKEIANLVTGIQSKTEDVKQIMESGTNQVLETTQLVESTKKNLNFVLEKSEAISLLMESIAKNTSSQANTSQSVTSLMQKIAQLSKTTSQSSQEVAESIMQTAQVAVQLQTTVAQFKVAD